MRTPVGFGLGTAVGAAHLLGLLGWARWRSPLGLGTGTSPVYDPASGEPQAGVPLARGWYRQIDIARNELFYEQPLTPGGFRSVIVRSSAAIAG